MAVFCPHFGACGGCTLQHLPYFLQLENKQKKVRALFQKRKIALPVDFPFFPGTPDHYRNRLDFQFTPAGLGLRSKSSKRSNNGNASKIIPVTSCPLANPKINLLLAEVQAWIKENRSRLDFFSWSKRTGTLEMAIIRALENTESSSVSFLLSTESSQRGEQIELLRQFAEKTTAKNVVVGNFSAGGNGGDESEEFFALKGSLFLTEILAGKKIVFSSRSFFQNNSLVAEKMVRYCRELLSELVSSREILVDLYGGAGTFGVTLGDLFSQTLILDQDQQNILCAQKNLVENGITHGKALAADAASLAKLNLSSGKDLVMVLDPPRTGLEPKTLGKILELQPRKIIYISCNPEQLAKEMLRFSRKYLIKSLAGFDLFPQTEHLEVIAEMEMLGAEGPGEE